jgi:hypothetical protein
LSEPARRASPHRGRGGKKIDPGAKRYGFLAIRGQLGDGAVARKPTAETRHLPLGGRIGI